MNAPGKFSAFFDKDDNFCNFLFAFMGNNPLLKRDLPKGSKFFPFRVDPFSERNQKPLGANFSPFRVDSFSEGKQS